MMTTRRTFRLHHERFRALAGALALVLVYLHSVAELYHVQLHPRLQALQGKPLPPTEPALSASDHCPLCELGAVTAVQAPTPTLEAPIAQPLPRVEPVLLAVALLSQPPAPPSARGPPHQAR